MTGTQARKKNLAASYCVTCGRKNMKTEWIIGLLDDWIGGLVSDRQFIILVLT